MAKDVPFDVNLEALISGARPKLLLHCCCAPCATHVIECLSSDFNVTVLFYNPNIMPQGEHDQRRDEFKKLLSLEGFAECVEEIVVEYSAAEFSEVARPYWDEPEGGLRCLECFRLRLERTARCADALGFDYFATTLTVSPQKNAGAINEIGSRVAGLYACDYLVSDFKKRGGYQRSVALSKQLGLYRQRYCGCVV
ncbi:MAG: epoxyqueuosine reductase QueH [Oscillospiraceae bacterium]|nr:epoxyqueuosine reductase QueH [Oscillospiraceae bacterium]